MNPFIGEIRLFSGTYAPQGWAFCDGQALSISENDALFALLGTTYGGDGQSTFNLPDLRSRVPVHQGQGRNGALTAALGQAGGAETVVLSTDQMSAHGHGLMASTHPARGDQGGTGDLASSSSGAFYGDGSPGLALSSRALAGTGHGLPHDNMPPWAALNFIISLWGIFPSQG